MNIRELRADEIECRVQQVKEKGCVLLLYKDARCDMRILDETFGILGWERKHDVIDGNLYCTVSVWDDARGRWISKQDLGTESNTEKEKGQASDSFKRACFNWGIGRELYTAPFIWISLDPSEVKSDGQRKALEFGIKFHVDAIGYENHEISYLIIKDAKGKERFKFGRATGGFDDKKPPSQPTTPKANENATTGQETPNNGTDNTKPNANQIKVIFGKMHGAGKTNADVIAYMQQEFGFEKTERLNMDQYKQVIKWLDTK